MLSQAYRDTWSSRNKLIFRFVFCYFLLYMSLMFGSGFLEIPIRWIGRYIFHIPYDYEVSGFGSGDNTYSYLSLFLNVIIAVVLTGIWTILDRQRKEYNTPFYWFLVALRFFIFSAMLVYGFVKVFQIQFQPPSLSRLLQPLGEFSPMGLAWTYMGYSKGFGMFAGLMEILGGILLVYRSTATLGAFIVIGVMTQVAMMNLMFDIPVKLFSIHIVFMALIIFLTDTQRFLNVFIKNKPTQSYAFFHPMTSRSYHKVINILKKIGLALLLIAGCILGYLGELNMSDINHRPALYGIWETEQIIKNGDTMPPLLSDKHRWRYLIIERKGSVIVKTMNDELLRYKSSIDTSDFSIELIGSKKATDSFKLKYDRLQHSILHLHGSHKQEELSMLFRKKDIDSFTLINTGFRWINERPFNK